MFFTQQILFGLHKIKSENTSDNKYIKINFNNLINNVLIELHKQNIQSVIIEGGTKILQSFIDKNLWDEARIFKTNKILIDGIKSPIIEVKNIYSSEIGGDKLEIICND